MSLPPELRVLCHQLTSSAPSKLLQNLEGLQRKALRCGDVLSTQDSSVTKTDNSESAVLVHKLKTQITTLLYGKSPEGRLVAIVLVKSIVDVGGWEILKGVESWVRGLLAILGKPDTAGAKKLCIISLTSIYTSTHSYQSLIREVTTPTLPAFVSSCLDLIRVKGSTKPRDAPASLVQAIFISFSTLIPRHPTIFRPFLKQIQAVTRPYLAPTLCDSPTIHSSVKQSARQLVVIAHQTAPKNTSGEEWSKGLRSLIVDAHSTADQVLRAVVEDWESSVGYVGRTIDVTDECQQLGESDDGLPGWIGIDAGIERLEGLLELLAEYFRHPTTAAVTVPLSHIEDLLARAMSVAPPTVTNGGSVSDGVRIRPGIERIEKESLFVGIPRIHVAALKVYKNMIVRLQSKFLLLSVDCLEHIVWLFPACSQDFEFRLNVYEILLQVLPVIGLSLPKSTVSGLSAIIRTCVADCSGTSSAGNSNSVKLAGKITTSGPTPNADEFLRNNVVASESKLGITTPASVVARQLLPILITHLPLHQVDAYSRASMDRTAVLTHNRDALLASVLASPIASNGKPLPSLIPHLVNQFGQELVTEALTRPRFPILPQAPILVTADDNDIEEDDPDHSELQTIDLMEDIEGSQITSIDPISVPDSSLDTPIEPAVSTAPSVSKNIWGEPSGSSAGNQVTSIASSHPLPQQPLLKQADTEPIPAANESAMETDGDSDDESVHLVMEMSDSDED